MISEVPSNYDDASQRVQNSGYQPIQQGWDTPAEQLPNPAAGYEYQWAPPVSFYHEPVGYSLILFPHYC